MHRHLLLALISVLIAFPATATTIVAAPRHDPKRACGVIKLVVANINRGQLKSSDQLLGPRFYSDRFGEVERDEEADFIESMRFSDGKKDKVPMGIDRLDLIANDEYNPQYVVTLIRMRWQLTRLVEDDMLSIDEVDDPHWASKRTTWLVTFNSNGIWDFREVPELFRLTNRKTRVKPCDTDFYRSVRATAGS